MNMKIYNSLTRAKEEFLPLEKGKVSMYVCGPTVYDEPHIGHARSAYIFDVIRRYLEYRGYGVIFVRNVTDVDDKIIEKAKKAISDQPSAISLERSVREISEKYLNAYHEDMDALGIRRPDEEPKATEYIPKMVKFIGLLIEKDRAYAVPGGDVYFDIDKAKSYGKLSNQNLDKMESTSRAASGESKKSPLDFALWKKAKESEPSWDSPWGLGRPGWHIECSAMSSDILGDKFDIHGGGIDLIFPHHENEIAQSEGAGKPFARYWIHNGLLTIDREKMAKSLGNFISIKEFLAEYKDADLLKLLFLNTHYRHPVDYTVDRIKDMRAEKERLSIALDRMKRPGVNAERKTCQTALGAEVAVFRRKFETAMDDDFNMPLALASIFELASELNRRSGDAEFLGDAGKLAMELAGIFGLELVSSEEISPEIMALIEQRNTAREAGDFSASDRIRKTLIDRGIILEDTKSGTVWRRKI
jgi:cysteinyl-tRNA synthetase